MVKRFVDFSLALILLVFFFPIFILVALCIKVFDPGPVIHWSKRVGRGGSLFLMPKFRTMKKEAPQLATHLMDDQSYLTPMGKFLRQTSLDELPQLYSILKGQMSLVGPRPALFNQKDLIELRTQNHIHQLKPGLTGWAQINGRDDLSISKKVELDLQYGQRQSFFFDCQILFLTFFRVIKKKGIKH